MNPLIVYDKLNHDKKEVAMINYVEEYALLWTNSKGGARATTERWFDQIESIKEDD